MDYHSTEPRDSPMRSDIEFRVKSFIAREVNIPCDRISSATTLFGDLGLDGADGWDLIDAFGMEFDVDLSDFNHTYYFGPEGAANPVTLIYSFVQEILLRRDPHDVWGLTPITVQDLMHIAEVRRWPRRSDAS